MWRLLKRSPLAFSGLPIGANVRVVNAECKSSKTKVHEHFESLLRIGPIPSFKIETTRIDKRFRFISLLISREIGTFIHQSLNIPVNVSNPAITFYIEV
jgi:thiamine biosynthesis protein ThiI